MSALALPFLLICEEGNVLAATAWAGNDSIRPAMPDHEFKAVIGIGEVKDGFLKCLRGFHRNYTKLIMLISQRYNYPRTRYWANSFIIKNLLCNPFVLKNLPETSDCKPMKTKRSALYIGGGGGCVTTA
jgi:hypothetical protein